jgi:hypothetical protein
MALLREVQRVGFNPTPEEESAWEYGGKDGVLGVVRDTVPDIPDGTDLATAARVTLMRLLATD